MIAPRKFNAKRKTIGRKYLLGHRERGSPCKRENRGLVRAPTSSFSGRFRVRLTLRQSHAGWTNSFPAAKPFSYRADPIQNFAAIPDSRWALVERVPAIKRPHRNGKHPSKLGAINQVVDHRPN